jgi:hypothetical protein
LPKLYIKAGRKPRKKKFLKNKLTKIPVMVLRVRIPRTVATVFKNTPKLMITKKRKCRKKKTNALLLVKTPTNEATTSKITLIGKREPVMKVLAPKAITILAVNSPLLIASMPSIN